MSRTIGRALEAARARLGASPAKRPDIEELVSRLAGVSRAQVHLLRDRGLTEAQWATLEAWLERRAAGEPVQYVTGRAAFRGIDLAVDPGVLVPRPETEGLVEVVIAVLREEAPRWPAPRVLDLGTGSGAIGLAIASEWPSASITATDVSAGALATAQANASALGLLGRVRFASGDWFDALEVGSRFEVIVANPPYIATRELDRLPREVSAYEPPAALCSGPSGLEDLRAIADGAPRHLVGGGLLALEVADSRAFEIEGWFEGGREWDGVKLIDDLGGRPRVLVARRTRGPAAAPAA
jgi:release factor glutamine methyltransferase